ncbi:MAG: EamA family transporter, partial [Tannerellaceae bacterium]
MLIGSRFGHLFMTLAPPAAAITGMLVLGERMSGNAIMGMLVTLLGIGLSIVGKGGGKSKKWHLALPLKGVMFGIGAGMGQGVGLVFSKLGMNYYMQNIDQMDKAALQM